MGVSESLIASRAVESCSPRRAEPADADGPGLAVFRLAALADHQGSVEAAEERTLVRAAQGGSPDALERLVRLHWRRAHRAAYLIVQDATAAEDIAQEALLSAVRSLDRFDRRRPFGPWLHRIVVNRALDWARKRSRRAEVGAEEVLGLVEAASPQGGPDELSERMLGALGSLERDQRAAVVLRYVLDYTPTEIAAILDVPKGTVASRIHRGLVKLEATLAEGVA